MLFIFDTKLQTDKIKNLNITRKVQIPSDSTLAELGYLLLTVYGAQGYHLFDFTIGKNTYGCDEESDKLVYDYTLEEAFNRAKKAVFTYDYGDDWTFDVKLVERKAERARLLSGTGRGIIEDVGGIYGLESFVEAFKEGKGEEYEEYCKWQGIREYDAETCKVDRINGLLEGSIIALECAYEGQLKVSYIEELRKWFEECFGVHFWSEE